MTVDITSHEELRELLGAPMPRAVTKERPVLHARDRDWLAASPFCLVATAGADGSCDVSPKGDPPGFALVLDERTIAIPERPGNRRADGYRNILDNPHVGLIFMIPGRTDTLRINGRARLVRDAPWFDDMVVKGHRPILAVMVEIEQIFYHCAKAFLRSELWQPESWQPDALPSRARLIKEVENPAETLADLERHYGPNYATTIYT
ncbi:pyridoxamine 5'-phosphate oxidase family protein [Micromonospora sp. DSM 115977]|uniref:Pyridoxamine 5'-phosphate oxidase family protein n=1 Tax=Micromonospora reichwaldensis TaxID=3075516 RepID=A0ABU2WQF2_9ACTN|nr:pyridoxamine 5'-phosphate oxidase family protein [Micromonospora sp. DSM 115977]MDT0528137.1 pyridoxamine 5'-phosphate oxidase family protein [Micromonospora sp. DSM 115977]